MRTTASVVINSSVTITVAALFFLLQVTHQFSSSHAFNPIVTSTTSTPLLSRLQDIQCELLLSIGRIPGTAMPAEWAASGAKLGLTLELEFTNEQCDYEMSKERLLKGDALMGTKLYIIDPLNEPSFISSKGKEMVKILPGAYGCSVQSIESQQYALRFFVDCPDGAVRNDVELPAERIYFLSSCWNVQDASILERAKRRQSKLECSIEEITQQLEELDSEMNSSNNNLFQKAIKFRESVSLVEKRGKLKQQLNELEQTYPVTSSRVVRGPNDIIFAKEGVIAVKRLRGAMGTKEQYHWIGKFVFNDFFEDDNDDDESDE
jgi:hypothetical protein